MKYKIRLRKLSEADRAEYIRLQQEISFIKLGTEDISTADLFEKNRLGFAIITEERTMCGHCAIKDITKEVPEVEIELFRKYHSQGIGYQAMFQMLEQVKCQYQKERFLYCLEPDNIPSWALAKKLGGIPSGIRKDMWIGEEDLEDFIRCHQERIDQHLKNVAEEFHVTPSKLLVYDICYEINVYRMEQLKKEYASNSKNEVFGLESPKRIPVNRQMSKERRKAGLMKLYTALLTIKEVMEEAGTDKEKQEKVIDMIENEIKRFGEERLGNEWNPEK